MPFRFRNNMRAPGPWALAGALGSTAAAVEHGGVLTLLSGDGASARIFVAAPSGGAPAGAADLVADCRAGRTVLATGPVPEMEALRQQISRAASARMRRSPCGGALKKALLCACFGIGGTALGLALGAAVMLPPAFPGFGSLRSLPPALASQMPMPPVSPEAAEHPGQGTPLSAFAPPQHAPTLSDLGPPPVSEHRDRPAAAEAPQAQAPDATPQTSGQLPRGAADGQAPSAPAAAHEQSRKPAAKAPDLALPPQARAESRKQALVAPGSGASGAAANSPLAGMSKDQVAKAVRAMAAIKSAVTSNKPVTEAMLADLPKAMADKLRAAMSPGRKAGPEGAGAGHGAAPPAPVVDPYGISSVPAPDTWAYVDPTIRIPLPGAGDVKSPADLKRFGLERKSE